MADAKSYRPQTSVNWKSKDAIHTFKVWKKEVIRILNGPMAKSDDMVKVNHVFIWAGGDAEVLIEAKQAEDPTLEIKNAETLLDTLQSCLTHCTYFREAREDFYKLQQTPEEGTTSYYSRIVSLYKLAEFPDNSEFLITDRLIHGCANSKCKETLMSKGKGVTLKVCLDLLRQHESVKTTMQHMEKTTKVDAAYHVRSKDPTRQSQKNGSKHKQVSKHNKQQKPQKKCGWCAGEPHKKDQCPAKDVRCNFCSKKGHLERACIIKKRSLRQNCLEVISDDDDSTPIYDMDSIHIEDATREVMTTVTFHTTQACRIQGKLDTGAMATCMPYSMLEQMNVHANDLTPTKAKLRGITGTMMKTIGELNVKASCNNITKLVTVIITKSGSELILGVDFCRAFELVKIANCCEQRELTVDMNAVHITKEGDVDYTKLRKKWQKHLPLGKTSGDALTDLKSIFPETFDGSVGLFEGEVDLKISSDAKPIQLGPRAVPQSVEPKLKKELDKMEKEGIIRACPETTDWVHNLVIANKKNGDIRICLDPRNLNKYLIRSLHYTASWEDAQHSFTKGKYFSTLDAKSGYWTKKLSKESQLLTAFNTPFKKYCFVRLPFGLSISAEVFSESMDKAMAGVPGTFPCADDVKVQGSTAERHDINLLETVERAQKAGIKFNPAKCEVKKESIEYFGRIISAEGVKPCPKKVRDILNLQAPENKQELQSFMGTINFMAAFIPNLAKKTQLMRSLLKKQVVFCWSSDMQKEFEEIKAVISSAMSLTHFDPNKPAVIETDASLKGLGAVLIQENKPVKFLSKSLTQAESGYSNIERELLAVLFACERLHTYVYGREVTIHTDHKPLEAIFLKPISLAPARLQRMLIRLRMYTLNVKYVGAKSVLVADTLSRLVIPGKDKEIQGLDITIAQVLNIRPTHLEQLQKETKTDESLRELKDLINNGWPERVNELTESAKPFWCFRDEMAVLDGLVLKGNRVVVPPAMRQKTLARLHDGHQGVSATLQRARRTVYWPKMQEDISAMLLECTQCQQHGRKKPRLPEQQHSTTKPMELLGMDLMEHRGEHFLATIDYFSGYIMIDRISSETTDAVKKASNNNFRKFGLPEKIQTDNGPCFNSNRFQQFCDALDIQHLTSSPHYHESNGRVERSIQTLKQMLKKTKNEEEMTMALISYHDTPQDAGIPSPAELFFKRRINSRLGLMFNPTEMSDQEKIQLHAKRSSHLKPKVTSESLTVNDSVWFTDDGCNEWKPGVIESKDTHPDSYWLVNLENGRRIRRNKHDLKPRVPIDSSDNIMPTPMYQPTPDITPIVPPIPLTEIPQQPTAEEPEQVEETTPPIPLTEIPQQPTTKEPQQVEETTPTPTVNEPIKSPIAKRLRSSRHQKSATPSKPPTPENTTLTMPQQETKTRSGRISRNQKDPNFVYK